MKIYSGKPNPGQFEKGNQLVRKIKTANMPLLIEKLNENKPLNRADKRFLKKSSSK